jgi:histidyl-tRNA synthetase
MQILSGPKGTRDFYPQEMFFREAIFSSWENTCLKYGFEPYDGPTFEHIELYIQKSGEEIEKQLYSFEDKAGRRLALRPELTPSLARMVAAKGNSLKRPIKWYSIPRLYRYEKMQKGRLREFFQLNMDILGISDITADAELIAASIEIMEDLGFTSQDFSVLISSRTLLEEIFSSIGIPSNKTNSIFALIDKRNKMDPDLFNKELSNILSSSIDLLTFNNILSIKSINELSQISAKNIPSLNSLNRLFELISYYGFSDYISFDLGVVRGLAYYTGIVFELFDKKRSLRAIAGGGRYDNLIKLYGGPPTPAVGFAVGDVVLGEMLKEKNFEPPLICPDVFIVSIKDDNYPESSIKAASMLRKSNISCEFSLKQTNIGKQMEQANTSKAKIVLFVGGDEEKNGFCKIKIMETGEEILFMKNNFISSLKSLLKKN